MFFFILEKISFFLSNVIFILLCIALFTLIELKVMSSVQRRKEPSLTGLLGLLQLLIIKLSYNSNFYYFFYYSFNFYFYSHFYVNLVKLNTVHIYIKKKIKKNSIRFYSTEHPVISKHLDHLLNKFNNTIHSTKTVKYVLREKKRFLSLRSEFLYDIKYDNCFDVLNPFFSDNEKTIIKKHFLSSISSIVDLGSNNKVFHTMENENHYLFYYHNTLFNVFITNVMIFEFVKKEIIFKKKKFFFYYLLFLREEDLYLYSINESDYEIVYEYGCSFILYTYFPPYEKLKDHITNKKDYNQLIRKINSFKYDLTNINSLTSNFQEFISVYYRELYHYYLLYKNAKKS